MKIVKKKKRTKKHPRGRHGWILLHPMFPISLSEYKQKMRMDMRLTSRKAKEKYGVVSASIRRTFREMKDDQMDSTKLLQLLTLKMERRWR